MEIRTEITDGQAAALAKTFRVAVFRDGADLIQQCAKSAEATLRRRSLLTAVAVEKSSVVVEQAAQAWEAITAKPLPSPVSGAQEIPAKG